MSFDLSILIPSWNGLELLRENLPSVLAAGHTYQERTGRAIEVLVVDDGSDDGTAEAVSSEFPEVRVIVLPENRGFAFACNRGFTESQFSLVALLNNDVRVEESYFVFQARHFEDDNVLAVTAKVFEWEQPILASGGTLGEFRRGFWSFSGNYDVASSEPKGWGRELLSAYAAGGFSTYCREKLESLGGFNELLSPFYWEDVDLSYRGWKRGWAVRYEPRSIAHHRTSATIKTHFSESLIRTVSVRNRLLFHWINLHSSAYFVSHLVMLLFLLVSRMFVFDVSFYRSFFEALGRLPEIRRLRQAERASSRHSDVDLSNLWKRFYGTAPIQIYRSREQVIAQHPAAQRAASCRPEG